MINEDHGTDNSDEIMKIMQATGGGSAYIVGAYTETGAKIMDGKTLLDSKANIEAHALNAGGIITPTIKQELVPSKKGRKKNVVQPITAEATYKEYELVFYTASAKIKTKVIGCMDEPNAVWLVFKSADDLIYEPEISSSVSFSVAGKMFKTLYYGIKAKWFENNHLVMVFLKEN